MSRRKGPRRVRDIDRPIENLATHPTETVTPKVLADQQRCDRRTIMKLVEAGKLDGYRVGREWRITIASARKTFAAEHHRHAS